MDRSVGDDFFGSPSPGAFHKILMQFVRDYFLIGGMPAVVRAYIKSQSFVETLHEQKALLDIYRLDLAKYGKKKEFAHLQQLFESCPEVSCQALSLQQNRSGIH